LMTKKIILLALSVMLIALGFPAEAQQPGKVPRVGYLSSQSLSANSTRIEAFRQGLRERVCGGEKHCSLSIDTQRENKMASPRSRPNWCLKTEVIVTPGPLPTRVT